MSDIFRSIDEGRLSRVYADALRKLDFSITSINAIFGNICADDVLGYFGITVDRNNIGWGQYSKGKIQLGYSEELRSEVAVKIVPLLSAPPNLIKHARDEIRAVRNMNHRNLCRTFHYFNVDSCLYVVMGYYGSNTLSDYMKDVTHISHDNMVRVTGDILSGLDYMYTKCVAHRDIKGENIMIKSKGNKITKAIIIDFGFAIKLRDYNEMCTTFCGTKNYKAPEIRLGVPYTPFKSDMWSLGILMAKILTGYTFFAGYTGKGIKEYFRINNGRLCFSSFCPKPQDPKIVRTITQLLSMTPTNRPYSREVLQHDWLRSSYKPVQKGPWIR